MKPVIDENDAHKQQLLLAAKKCVEPKVSVPVDQFKAFCVYEDENKRPTNEPPSNISLNKTCDTTDLSLSVIRYVQSVGI